jgi:hypothetical protein
MTGWEEIKINYTVKMSNKLDTDEPYWYLVLHHAGREGGFIVQRWDHEPASEEIESVKFAASQGVHFITSYLACTQPPRRVEVLMPRIRLKIIDELDAATTGNSLEKQ